MSIFCPKDNTPPDNAESPRSERGRAARASGYDAEDTAAGFLEDEGVRIIARNVRSRGGELDIVGIDRGILLFIEVRMRKAGRFGGAAESITREKQRRIANAARLYLNRNPARASLPCRFDCILMDGPDTIEWLRDAFRLD